jgi:hypothetical protein
MQPYPTSTQMPQLDKPPVPPQVSNAIKAMYVGAATSILGIVIDILTVSATKTAIEKHSRHLTASQHTLVIAFVVAGLVGAAVWIFLARACKDGNSWARTTGTALFGLATVDVIVGVSAPVAGPVKIWGLVVWLVGLTAVIFLWQRASTAFFRGTRSS